MAPTNSNNRFISKLQQQWPLTALLALFALLYALIAVVNHLKFNTYCLDLGVYTKALWDYAHLRVCDSSLYLWEAQNFLCDHLDLYVVLLSPLVYLFGQYTLIIIQIAAVLAGGWGMHRLVSQYVEAPAEEARHGEKRVAQLLPLAASYCYLAFFGTWHALGFDYHSNVVAAALFPWMLGALKKKRLVAASVLAFVMCLAKETIPVWLFFVFLALLWDYRKERPQRRWLLCALCGTVVYFAVIALMVMPALGGDNPAFWRYAYMGGSFGQMAVHIATHPWQTLVNFCTNFIDADSGRGLKPELALCLLATGALMAVRKPNWLLMLVPLLAQKWLAWDVGFWGVGFHYNAEFGVVLAAGSFIALAEWHEKQSIAPRAILLTALLCCVVNTAVTRYTCTTPLTQIRRFQVDIASREHYRNGNFDTHVAKQLVATVPADASVCAATFFVPHLACRDSVWLFPIGLKHNAEYYLLLHDSWTYYDGDREQVERLAADTAHYQTLFCDERLLLLRRRGDD